MENAQFYKTNLIDSGDDVKLQVAQQNSDRDGDNAVELNQISSAVGADISRPANIQYSSSAGTTRLNGPQATYLEDYIHRAYEDMQGFSDPSPRIFTRSPGPELQRGRENRIVIYPGCFNPPHAGHAALLWHTYLNTDANTIAVMIFALSDDCLDSKDHVTDNKGKAFILSHYQRRELWKDEVLGRFAWVFPEDDDDRLDMFMATVKRLAKLDGFKVSFPTLYGGDHITQKSMANGLWGWDGRTCVSSDVTRPMDFVPEDGSCLLQLEECEKWKEMKNEGQEWTGKDNATSDCWPCWPCWPCAKMRKVFPEGVLKNGSFSFGKSPVRCCSAVACC